MADMCGPSNALQNFQKHSTVDRTLQQDRLISRSSPSQGFRSSQPNTRQFDPEFEAFQAGNLPLDHTFSHPLQQFQPGPSSANWANDFQRLNISQPLPQQQNDFNIQRRGQDAGWHHEFSQLQNENRWDSKLTQEPHYSAYASQPSLGIGIGMQTTGMYGNGLQMGHPGFVSQQKEQQMDRFDDAAFEAAFQQAAKEAEAEALQAEPILGTSQDQSQHLETQQLPRTLEEAISTALPIDNAELLQPLIGADTIHDPNRTENEQHTKEDPDALARTAQRLVDSLSGDSRQKLQESEFMKLMRGFAGGHQVIVGDEVVGRGEVDVR